MIIKRQRVDGTCLGEDGIEESMRSLGVVDVKVLQEQFFPNQRCKALALAFDQLAQHLHVETDKREVQERRHALMMRNLRCQLQSAG
jgi:hypothetical protein